MTLATADRLRAAVGGRVEIIRDRAGVPHIYAASTADVYYGLGFAMAQDRLWQIDRLRRRALGTQAQILGRSYVESDLIHRAVDIEGIAEREVERTDDRTRLILERFVEGINRSIEVDADHLPTEFKLLGYEPARFTVRDVIAILRGLWWSLNGRLQNIAIAHAAKLLPERLRAAYLTPEAPENRILPPGTPFPSAVTGLAGQGDGTGSNNWAVAGSRTTSGKALLAGDPHQPFWVPSSWYEFGLHGPEDHAAGAGHPGVPGLWWGANGSIAWALTNNAASTRDLYQEQVHPTDSRLYRDGDTWRPFDEHEVVIEVRGEAPVRHTQRATVRGPIVNHVVPQIEEGEPPLSLRWVGQEHLDDIRAAVHVGRARDWDAFRDALRDWSVAVFNFVYADHEGHVGYQCAGRVPIRGRQTGGYREANESADEWQGYVPFDGLPRAFDPARGYVASANERVAPDDYPYPLHGSWGSGYRARRIAQAIESTPRFSREQVVALQNDVKSCRAERWCPPLVDRLGGASDPAAATLRDALATWDYRYEADTRSPALFETFLEVWQERVVAARFPSRLVPLLQGHTGVAEQLLERGDPDAWFAGDLTAELVATASEVIARLSTRFGPDPAGWRWGNIHQAHWRHPLSNDGRSELDVGPRPVNGSLDTVRNTGSGQPPFAAASGAEYRIVVDFAQPDRFDAVQNIGNSGRSDSPHYADQFEPWLAGTYHTVSLRREDVERDAEASTVLEP